VTRKRWIYLLLIAIVVLIGAFVVVVMPVREPGYGGRRLSEWLAYASHPYSRSHPDVIQTEEAIRKIGTNALPYLVRWVQYERPAWKSNVYLLLRKLLSKPSIGVRDDRQTIRAEACVIGFRALGSEGKAAIEELSQIMNDPKSERSAQRAASALAALGDDALPAFLNGATNKNSGVRLFVCQRCRFLIGHPNDEIRCTATNVLRALDPGALMEMELRGRVRPPPLLKIPNAREVL